MHKGILLLAGLVILTPPALTTAIEGPTIELGKTLFESTELGDSGRSCSSCHENGKGLEKVGQSDDAVLKSLINRCIRNALGGEVLDTDSQEMEALLRYLRVIGDR